MTLMWHRFPSSLYGLVCSLLANALAIANQTYKIALSIGLNQFLHLADWPHSAFLGGQLVGFNWESVNSNLNSWPYLAYTIILN